MRFAWASLGCMALVFALLAARGASDWSDAFALLWYGLWGAAIFLALIGIGSAVFGAGHARSRIAAAGVSTATLVLTFSLVLMIASTLSHVS